MDFLGLLDLPPRERNLRARTIFAHTTKDSRDRLYYLAGSTQFRLESPTSYRELNRLLGNGPDWDGDLQRLRSHFHLCPETGLPT